MQYTLSYAQAHQHFLDISLSLDASDSDILELQLPAWRPGRYELSNFAKNIQKWAAFDENGTPLPWQKKTKDLWEVSCKKAAKVEVKYTYYANQLNAGSTYLDHRQLYINPVNCLFYLPDRMNQLIEVSLELPENYRLATSLKIKEKHRLLAENYDELADSPILCSPTMQHDSFQLGEHRFHLWFQGEFKPDWELLKKDFKAFSAEQIMLFGDFPVKEYHFIFQVLTTPFYHGVEHSASTVIVLGPSYSLLKKEGRYEDLLGVSSHELFHTWNVKRIRPLEMWPYDFSRENYTRLGYLTEGATTWYGDLMLYRSGVFNEAMFFRTFNQLLNRHFNNPGARNLSVAETSFDTWLDGYEAGIPNRKASIYTEGALITFFLDVAIRKSTANKQSFDQVMQRFYRDFYLSGKGVSEEDYRQTVEDLAGKKLDSIFERFINGACDFTDILISSLDYLGLRMEKKPTEFDHESFLGIRVLEDKVQAVFPDSPADKAGIASGDQLIAINEIKLNDNLSDWLQYFKNDPIRLKLIRENGSLYKTEFSLSKDQIYYANYSVHKQEKLSPAQKKAFEVWMRTHRPI